MDAMEDLSVMKISELRALAESLGLDVKSRVKADFINAIADVYEQPRIVTEDQPVVQEKTILYFPGAIYNPGLGRYEKGYHLFSNADAEKWLSVARRVRVASPGEVAAYYGA